MQLSTFCHTYCPLSSARTKGSATLPSRVQRPEQGVHVTSEHGQHMNTSRWFFHGPRQGPKALSRCQRPEYGVHVTSKHGQHMNTSRWFFHGPRQGPKALSHCHPEAGTRGSHDVGTWAADEHCLCQVFYCLRRLYLLGSPVAHWLGIST